MGVPVHPESMATEGQVDNAAQWEDEKEDAGPSGAGPRTSRGFAAVMENVMDSYYETTAKRPWCMCLSTLGVCFLLLAMPFAVFQADAIEVDMSLDSFEIKGDTVASRSRSHRAAWCGGPCGSKWRRRLDGEYDRQLRSGSGDGSKVVVAYASKDGGNMLTESGLREALELEKIAKDALGIDPYQSPLKLLFPNYPEANGLLTGGALTARLITMAESRHVPGATFEGPWFDESFTACNTTSKVASSIFFRPWDAEESGLKKLSSVESKSLHLAFWPNDISYFESERNEQIMQDTFLLGGVLTSVFLILVIVTGSPFLTSMGLLSICLSTGVALFMYRFLISKWFGILNAFAFFLLLGIGCDDIFVLSDTWSQSTQLKSIPAHDYAERLRYTLPRAGKAIFTTSITTAVAFFGNLISVIPPLRLFGVFSGLMVLADFVLTIMLLPSVLVLQHKLFKDFSCGGWCKAAEPGQSRKVDVWLARYWAPRIIRWAPVVVLLSAVVAGVALNVALELPSGAEFHESNLFPTSHNQHRAREAQLMLGSGKNPQFVGVQFIYGVVPEDTGASLDPSSESEVIWDTGYDVFDPKIQQFTLDFCTALLGERGLVRSLQSCWAQSLQSAFLNMGLPFPSDNRQAVERAIMYGQASGLQSREGGFWAEINVKSTVDDASSTADLRKYYDQFEDFLQKWNQEALQRGVPSCSRGFHTAMRWVHMATIESLAMSSIGAVCISTAFVTLMLLLSFRNPLIVALLMLHIIGISLTLVTFLVIGGRSLGVLESIALSLLIGLAVDYLAHLTTAFVEEGHGKTRVQLAVAAMAHLGGSVLAGAFTTIISAVFLLMGTITFFSTFGVFILEIIGLALFATLFPFVGALSLFGPENGAYTVPCPTACGGAPQTAPASPDKVADGVQAVTHSKRVRYGTGIGSMLILLIAGGVRIGITFTKTGEEAANCPDLEYLDYTFEDYEIPAQLDTYRCRGFKKVPPGCTYYITRSQPLVNPPSLTGHVHHMIVYSIEHDVSDCPFACFDMPNAIAMDMAWAVGQGEIKWPEGAGYPIGGAAQALQMHYENPLSQAGLVDKGSGLRLYVTKEVPKMSLTSLLIGLHPLADLRIPPGAPNATVVVECSPVLRGDVTVIAHTPHAHKVAVSLVTEVFRQSAKIGDVGIDRSYNFNFQSVHQFPSGQERVLKPGDLVRIFCTYDTRSRSEDTVGGWRSVDEMCMTFLFAYPSSNVASRNCVSMSTQML